MEKHKIVVHTASFPDVLGGLWDLALRGNVNLEDPDRLQRTAMVVSLEFHDTISRNSDGLHLVHALTPTVEDVVRGIPSDFNFAPADEEVIRDTSAALRLTDSSLGAVGQTAFAARGEIAKLIYYIACRLKGNGTVEERRLAQSFLLQFLGFGRQKPEIRETLGKYERWLGRVFIMQFLALQTRSRFDLPVLTAEMIRKYGSRDINGLYTCYWEKTGTPCECGGRKSDMRASLPFDPKGEIPTSFVNTVDTSEMYRSMAVVYGVSRNQAIDTYNGVLRVMTEVYSELGFMQLLCEHISLGAFERSLGSLADQDARHFQMARKKLLAEGHTYEEGLLFEAADAIDWFPLLCCAYGLDFVACITRAMQFMAERSNIDLSLPEKMLASL